MSTLASPSPAAMRPARRFGFGRVLLIVVGSVVALIAFGLLAAGAGLVWANTTQRDAGGFFTTGYHHYGTPTAALTYEDVDVFANSDAPGWVTDPGRLATARIKAHSLNGKPIFVGIAPTHAVRDSLLGAAHDRVSSVEFRPFHATYERVAAGTPTRGIRTDWATAATGLSPTVTWPVEQGNWSLVIRNADGSRGVAADVKLGMKVNFLGWVSLGLFAGGILLAAAAAALIMLGVRRPPGDAPPGSVAVADQAEGAVDHGSPVAVDATLEPKLSRWLWLVKWLLLIPHAVVLVFLWIAFAVLTLVAFFAILFTGRYPRALFDFNLGVLRWTWRVVYYSYGALGTDRYPPFTLADVPDYPARLDIEYPERLSRWQVLVKSWLLAFPHLMIVTILVGAFWGPWYTQLGLIMALVIVVQLSLLFLARYPAGLFDLVMGLNRWVLRVARVRGAHDRPLPAVPARPGPS